MRDIHDKHIEDYANCIAFFKAKGNPDMGQNPHRCIAPTVRHKGDLNYIVKCFIEWRDFNNVGGGNCPETEVKSLETNEVLAIISYNGRTWTPEEDWKERKEIVSKSVYMSLADYVSQAEPKRMPKVMLEQSEVRISSPVKATKFLTLYPVTILHPSLESFNYVVEGGGSRLFTTDAHGNPKNASYFRLKEQLPIKSAQND